MQSATESFRYSAPVSAGVLWTGRIMSALVVVFMLFNGIIKVIQMAPATEVTEQLGYPAGLIPGIGILELACTIVYAIPRTSVLGAILLTGYLGGAVATHLRIGDPLMSHTLFPVYLGLLAWGGLYLRNRRLRGLLPLMAR